MQLSITAQSENRLGHQLRLRLSTYNQSSSLTTSLRKQHHLNTPLPYTTTCQASRSSWSGIVPDFPLTGDTQASTIYTALVELYKSEANFDESQVEADTYAREAGKPIVIAIRKVEN
jgi:hypothetical protein